MPVSSTENVVRIADPITDGEMCAWVQGLLEQIVVLAGGKAPTVDHEACVTRGDAACLYRVVWNR
jgi:predicted hydrocarbon binding protein